MAHPIYVPPTSVTYQIAPAQYAELITALRGSGQVSNLAVTGNAGSALFVKGISLGWSYDGAAKLTVTILSKHGLIDSHISNATIFDNLAAQLKALG